VVPSYDQETGASKGLMRGVGSMRWLLKNRLVVSVFGMRALQSSILVETGSGGDLMGSLAAPNERVALRRARVDDGACLDFLRLKPWELSLARWLT
jgi:hypothetical protein